MKEFIHPNDPYHMNWIEGNTEWGTVKAPKGINVSKSSKSIDDILTETYTFTNITNRDIFTSLRDISIYAPFADDYKSSAVCMTMRCHTHIWCGEHISYVMALRMGGKSPHLGLVLTEGSLGGYSIERDLSQISNDRGDFIFHPSPVALAPKESFSITWTLFWHNGKEDFYQKLPLYHPNHLAVHAKSYVIFEEEELHLTINPAFSFSASDITISEQGRPVSFVILDQTILIKESGLSCGEHSYDITVKNIKTHCKILVLPALDKLVTRRCHFIVEKQQYHSQHSKLDGAYLTYDNEDNNLYYNSKNDYNGGRERIGMGILLARYLQSHKDTLVLESLSNYITYVERELFDTESGTVYNDYQKNNSHHRLYNYPWISVFYIELYRLFSDKHYLQYAYHALCSFYQQGGTHFYAIEVPLEELSTLLSAEHMEEECNMLMTYFREHCDRILANGLHYPAHEVNYEQSIVAPAASLLLQMYIVTKEEKYLEGAKLQLDVLELFHGRQPDYHLYETAIRHWDGYWFGKRKLYGDTFPHYWSALSANIFYDYAKTTGDNIYFQKAEASHRGVLSLFHADGSASCAYLYPVSVNGEAGRFYDPYANDQDWGLYFMLKYYHTENSKS